MPQVILIEADHVQGELAKLLAHRLFVKHAQHCIFAMHRWHDRDAKIDKAALVLHTETAVLRHAPLSDVQLAHYLDAGHDG